MKFEVSQSQRRPILVESGYYYLFHISESIGDCETSNFAKGRFQLWFCVSCWVTVLGWLGGNTKLKVWKLGLIIQQSVSPEGTGQYLYLQQQ